MKEQYRCNSVVPPDLLFQAVRTSQYQTRKSTLCFITLRTEVGMFESDKEIVNDLLKVNRDFRRMYDKHDQLNREVDHANRDTRSMDEFSLENLKKEKLLLKDRMAVLIENHRQSSH